MKSMHKCWIFAVTVLFMCGIAQSQQKPNEIKLKLAQSYERGRDYENAIKLYEEVYAKDSNNVNVFEALKRNYLIVKKYPEVISLMNRMLRLTPRDLSLWSQLGAVYVRSGDEAKGFATWEQAILLDSTGEVTYSVVANAMSEVRSFDRAIATYLRGRNACNNQGLFIPELASLYGNTLKYAEATTEYLKLIRNNTPQLPFVQSRMTMYIKSDEGLKATTEAVEQATAGDPDNLILPQLLAWLYMEGKRYDVAFDVYKRIDERTKSGGNEIYNFAQRAFRDKAYAIAAKAYLEVIQSYPKMKLLPQVKFGYARTLEELTSSNDTLRLFGQLNPFKQPEKPVTESEPQFVGAVSEYKQIVNDYPKTEIAARSLLRIAALMFERDFNLDEAQSTLTDLATSYIQFIPLIAEGKILQGEIYLAQGNLDKAEETFTSLGDLRPVAQDLRDQAGLRLAEILYFHGRWKDALEKLGGVMSNISSNTTNDALTLQIFIQGNQEKNSAALGEFAKADLLKRQRKLSEALAVYQEIFQKDTTSELADEALMSMGDVQSQMQHYTDAASLYQRLVDGYGESINLDRATMKMGQVYELGLHDTTKAIDAYEQLLKKFPFSIYISEARKRIRELRGDSL